MTTSDNTGTSHRRFVRLVLDMEVEITDQVALESSLVEMGDNDTLIDRGTPGEHGNDFRVAAAVSDIMMESGMNQALSSAMTAKGLKWLGSSLIPRFRDESGDWYREVPKFPARRDDGSFPEAATD